MLDSKYTNIPDKETALKTDILKIIYILLASTVKNDEQQKDQADKKEKNYEPLDSINTGWANIFGQTAFANIDPSRVEPDEAAKSKLIQLIQSASGNILKNINSTNYIACCKKWLKAYFDLKKYWKDYK